MQNKPASKYPMAKISNCEVPPPPCIFKQNETRNQKCQNPKTILTLPPPPPFPLDLTFHAALRGLGSGLDLRTPPPKVTASAAQTCRCQDGTPPALAP